MDRTSVRCVDASDAVELIRAGVPAGPAVWADLGCGRGTFTRALATLLAPGSYVLAVDRDARALRTLRQNLAQGFDRVEIVAARGDLRRLGRVAELGEAPLDGALFANVLHFLTDPAVVLARVAGLLAPDGGILVVEYDDRPASPWVPHPLPLSRLTAAAEAAGLQRPVEIGRRPSAYRGTIYCARMEPA